MTPDGTPLDTLPPPEPSKPAPAERLYVTSEPAEGWHTLYGRYLHHAPRLRVGAPVRHAEAPTAPIPAEAAIAPPDASYAQSEARAKDAQLPDLPRPVPPGWSPYRCRPVHVLVADATAGRVALSESPREPDAFAEWTDADIEARRDRTLWRMQRERGRTDPEERATLSSLTREWRKRVTAWERAEDERDRALRAGGGMP